MKRPPPTTSKRRAAEPKPTGVARRPRRRGWASPQKQFLAEERGAINVEKLPDIELRDFALWRRAPPRAHSIAADSECKCARAITHADAIRRGPRQTISRGAGPEGGADVQATHLSLEMPKPGDRLSFIDRCAADDSPHFLADG
jgi:hypothetical protein